jgi:hypothetical protein
VCFFCGEDILVKFDFDHPGTSERRACTCVGARMARASIAKRKGANVTGT